MTPRSVAGHNSSTDFARQVAEQQRQRDGQPALKKFKATSAPKGTKLAKGYEDRTTSRRQDEEEVTDKEKKLRELEDMVKSEKIDRDTFEKLRDQMGVGGSLGTTHLVKGLDRKLLERIRRGEDLNASPQTPEQSTEPPADIDDELDTALEKDVVTSRSDESKPTEDSVLATHQTLTRDEILRQLKESRNAKAQVPAAPVLDGRFKKVPTADKPGKKKFVETINGRRREVLVISDKDGNTKRKTRWIDPEPTNGDPSVAAPLGMEVPAEFLAKQKALAEQDAAEEDDDDIFQGAGAEYDPLKDIDSGSEQEQEDDTEPVDADVEKHSGTKARNYFGEPATENTDQSRPVASDPTILAALKRAAAIRQCENNEKNAEAEAQSEKQRQFLARLKQRDREDAEDMDLGFGESRFGDEDEDGPIWEGEEEGGGSKRKRGPKKRKGDKDNVGDVMSVLDGRKKS